VALTDEGIIKVDGLASRYVRLASGAKAHYMTAGEDGPAVLLLHGGLPGSSATAGWRFMAPFLGAKGFRVYAPDMPGYGLSDTAPEYRPKGLHTQVEFIHEFVTALCLDEFHIAGNSMGCMNSVNYIVAHPSKILSFALIAGDFGDLTAPLKRPAGSFRPDYDGSRESMRENLRAIIHKSEAISEDLVDMRQGAAQRHREGAAAYFAAMMEYVDNTISDPNIAAQLSTKGRFDKLTIPGVYLYGQDDVLCPVEWGYEQEKHLPNVQCFYPADCGHQGQTDQPEIFNQLFLEFFRDGKVARRTADAAGVSKHRAEIPSLVEQV
jgi:pimeloyl-ACP methyl ester carboxylesterase